MSSADYWRERAQRLLLAEERKGAELIRALIGIYSATSARLQEDIDAFYRRYAGQEKMSLESARRMLTPSENRNFQTALAHYLSTANRLGFGREHTRYLRTLAGQAQITRQQALLAQARQQVENLFRNGEGAFHSALENVYGDGYRFTAQGLRLSGDFARLDTQTIEALLRNRWLGENYSSRLWKHKTQLVQQLEELIPRAFATGENSRVLGQMLAERLGVSRAAGERLARTEVNHAANQSSLAAYRRAGVTHYEFLATLDKRTSATCAALDGKVFAVTDAAVGVNFPPMHPNCRSTTIPHFPPDEFDGDNVRAARNLNGCYYTVPADMNYGEWKNTAESGMLDKISLEPIAITEAVIAALHTPPVPGWDDAQNAMLAERHRELLRLASNQPPGIEVGMYLDERLEGAVSALGEFGRLDIDLTRGMVYMHNHPSGNLFTLEDVENLLFNENMRVLTAVGNNGHVYLLAKTEDFDFSGVHAIYRDKVKIFADYEKSPEAYVRFMNEFLSALWPYGLIYLEG